MKAVAHGIAAGGQPPESGRIHLHGFTVARLVRQVFPGDRFAVEFGRGGGFRRKKRQSDCGGEGD
ncbi:hypothetical protein [Victivallis vadensis]|uniref:hypothetical protein n=1 Tax=Victivallis vadensis TaxID=172901 RepID=UPI00164E7BE0|nr:hypothetical protein [Victivallis vadensis]